METTQYVDVKNSKFPPAKFFDRLADIVQGHEFNSSPGDVMKAPDEVLPPEDDLIAKKEEQELKLKKLESQAIQHEQKGEFGNALKCWREIKHIDPSFPQVDIKIDELEKELRREKEKREHEAEQRALREKEKLEIYTSVKSSIFPFHLNIPKII